MTESFAIREEIRVRIGVVVSGYARHERVLRTYTAKVRFVSSVRRLSCFLVLQLKPTAGRGAEPLRLLLRSKVLKCSLGVLTCYLLAHGGVSAP